MKCRRCRLYGLCLFLLFSLGGCSADGTVIGDDTATVSEVAPPTLADHIAAVLREDQVIHNRAQSAMDLGTDQITAVNQMVASMKGIDTSDCPADFREAYARHCSAWAMFGRELENAPATDVDAVFFGAMNALNGEWDGGIRRLNQGIRDRQQAIHETWAEVEALAARHGAH